LSSEYRALQEKLLAATGSGEMNSICLPKSAMLIFGYGYARQERNADRDA
jgi:hypothetical protein